MVSSAYMAYIRRVGIATRSFCSCREGIAVTSDLVATRVLHRMATAHKIQPPTDLHPTPSRRNPNLI
jgi:hypothetical protein